jgi:two-component system alkaline phosphatase synthesis response regulator PhoP
MAYKILVVDDEADLLKTVRDYLVQSGFEVISASNGRDALFLNRDEKPDLVVMDIMMPEMDGWEASRLIHRESDVPIIMLTARDEDADKIAALEMGVDDYVTKPFNPRLLVARVRAVLRRTHGESGSESRILRVKDLELDQDTYEVKLHDQLLELTRIEFDLLATLMEHPGRVFTRMELLEHVHGEAFAAYERTIDVHIKNLRAKLETDPREPEYIETVYGVGYRMIKDDA